MPILLREVPPGEPIAPERLTQELAADPLWGPIHAGITYRSRERALVCHVKRVPTADEVAALDRVLAEHAGVPLESDPDG